MSNERDLNNAKQLARNIVKTWEDNAPPLEPQPQLVESKEEVVSVGSMKDVSFTVSIHPELNEKFNLIWAHYQSKLRYGRVYKKEVLGFIIDEVYERLENEEHIK